MPKQTRTKKIVVENTEVTPKKFAPAITPEARENQLISLAMNLAEKHLLDGTASAQEITHFLKLGTQKEKLEKEILGKQSLLLDAKTDSIKSAQKNEELYKNAIEAMKKYSGYNSGEDYYED